MLLSCVRSRSLRPVAPLLLLLLLLAWPASAASPQAELLITPEQLAERLGSSDLVVLHVGADRESFDGGHVPGARYLPWGELATARDGVPNEFPPPAELRTTFSRLGVGDGSKVVLYDAARGLLAARAFVALELIDFGGELALLDGHLAGWRAAEKNVESGPPSTPEAAGTLAERSASAAVVTADAVRRAYGSGQPQLIDARSRAQYTGEEPGRDVAPARAGHLPGARHVHWEEHLAEGDVPRLRPVEELRALYEGLDATKPVVAYCRTGVQASHTYFVLRYLGYRPHLYDASYIEWHADPEAPVKQGEEP